VFFTFAYDLIVRQICLNVNNFDYKQFDYDDIRCIYNSPRSLIEDFEKVNGFKMYVRTIIKEYKINKNKLFTPIENNKINKIVGVFPIEVIFVGQVWIDSSLYEG
jgi:hypothetical protein